MKNFSISISIFFFFFSVVCLLIQPSFSATILINGGLVLKNSSVHVGDSIIFEQKNSHYNLYIFKNKNAFDVCHFTQATILTKPNSTSYTWHPSRPGFYYFSFNNGTTKLNTCQKLAIQVSTPPHKTPAPKHSPAPNSGDPVTSSPPQYPWPFRPHQNASSSPGPTSTTRTTTESAPMTVPSLLPGKNGGIPFINSNPVVPLPIGEVDSATILPLSTSSGYRVEIMVGLLAEQAALFYVFLSLMVLLL